MPTNDAIASWVQSGGVLAFSALVFWLLRQLLPVLGEIKECLHEMRVTLGALLERDRMRDEREAADRARTAPVPRQSIGLRAVPEPESWDEDETPLAEAPRHRARTAPFGHPTSGRPPTRGGG